MMEDQTAHNPTPSTTPPKARLRPRVVGLSGGVAAGKSMVAQMLADLGAKVIDADRIAREVLESRDVCEKIRSAWGAEVFDNQGKPDRKRIAEIVFDDPQKRLQLNRWIHPATRRRMTARLEEILRDDQAIAVIDAPLLVEANLDAWCDIVLFVDAPLETRQARAAAEREWDPAEVLRREAAQKPLQEKRNRATIVIANNNSREKTFAQVERLFREWSRLKPTNIPHYS